MDFGKESIGHLLFYACHQSLLSGDSGRHIICFLKEGMGHPRRRYIHRRKPVLPE